MQARKILLRNGPVYPHFPEIEFKRIVSDISELPAK